MSETDKPGIKEVVNMLTSASHRFYEDYCTVNAPPQVVAHEQVEAVRELSQFLRQGFFGAYAPLGRFGKHVQTVFALSHSYSYMASESQHRASRYLVDLSTAIGIGISKASHIGMPKETAERTVALLVVSMHPIRTYTVKKTRANPAHDPSVHTSEANPAMITTETVHNSGFDVLDQFLRNGGAPQIALQVNPKLAAQSNEYVHTWINTLAKHMQRQEEYRRLCAFFGLCYLRGIFANEDHHDPEGSDFVELDESAFWKVVREGLEWVHGRFRTSYPPPSSITSLHDWNLYKVEEIAKDPKLAPSWLTSEIQRGICNIFHNSLTNPELRTHVQKARDYGAGVWRLERHFFGNIRPIERGLHVALGWHNGDKGAVTDSPYPHFGMLQNA